MPDLWKTNNGIYLGYLSDKTEGDPQWHGRKLVRYEDDRHIVTVGPNGSGKSRRLLLPNLAELTGWSTLVVDPKGELAYMTEKYRADRGSTILRLNPFNALEMGSDGFNPVAALDPASEEFPDDALSLAEALIRTEGIDPHWSQAAQDLVCALIMYVRILHGANGSLADVRKHLSEPAVKFRETIDVMVSTANAERCDELAIKSSHFAGTSTDNREINGVLATALAQTRWLDSPPIKADLAHGSFDFGLMKEKPVTVFLILPARRLSSHSTWLRLMISAILQPLLKDTRKAKVPVLFMLDEYFAIARGGFPIIEDNMAMMRGFGIKLWTVWQDLAQAKRLYGENGWESFVGNAGVLQSFAPQDVITADYLSKRTGQTSDPVIGASRSTKGGRPESESISYSQAPLPLMLPQDLRNMDVGYSVMFSHMKKGTYRTYLPDPRELPHLKDICALDPAS